MRASLFLPLSIHFQEMCTLSRAAKSCHALSFIRLEDVYKRLLHVPSCTQHLCLQVQHRTLASAAPLLLIAAVSAGVQFLPPWSLDSLTLCFATHIVSQPCQWKRLCGRQLYTFLLTHNQSSFPKHLQQAFGLSLPTKCDDLLVFMKIDSIVLCKFLEFLSCISLLLLVCHAFAIAVAQATSTWATIAFKIHQALSVTSFKERWVWTKLSFLFRNNCVPHLCLCTLIAFWQS